MLVPARSIPLQRRLPLRLSQTRLHVADPGRPRRRQRQDMELKNEYILHPVVETAITTIPNSDISRSGTSHHNQIDCRVIAERWDIRHKGPSLT